MKEHTEEIVKLLGTGLLIGVFLVMFGTILIINNSEDKKRTVAINDYGEAQIELFVIFPLVGCFGLMSFYLTIKRLYLLDHNNLEEKWTTKE